ncbi:hypothetical protein [Helicobacter suis]|uniref:hypothetical protein n=1 Tax=Helicobacter suis TaxID=104628 RepID=UPI0013D8040B|nr:hypothetical protein [Helicobacter suis]
MVLIHFDINASNKIPPFFVSKGAFLKYPLSTYEALKEHLTSSLRQNREIMGLVVESFGDIEKLSVAFESFLTNANIDTQGKGGYIRAGYPKSSFCHEGDYFVDLTLGIHKANIFKITSEMLAFFDSTTIGDIAKQEVFYKLLNGEFMWGEIFKVDEGSKTPIEGQTKSLEELGSEILDLYGQERMLEHFSSLMKSKIKMLVDIAAKHFLDTQKISLSNLTFEQIEKWQIPNIPLIFFGTNFCDELTGINVAPTREVRREMDRKNANFFNIDVKKSGWVKPSFSVSTKLAKNIMKGLANSEKKELDEEIQKLINLIKNKKNED